MKYHQPNAPEPTQNPLSERACGFESHLGHFEPAGCARHGVNVAEHVELAYAVTSMGAQGRTVDHAITVLDGVTDVRNIYVPMTRGRHSNHAYITIEGEDTAADVFARYITNDWIDLPAHQRAHELCTPTGRDLDWQARAITHEDDLGVDY